MGNAGLICCVVWRTLDIANICLRQSPCFINSCLRVGVLVFLYKYEEQNKRRLLSATQVETRF